MTIEKTKRFEDLGLSEALQRNISSLGFSEPTEIQSKAIPVVLNESHDLVVLSQTGTGKTAAYGLPLLSQLNTEANYVKVLVLVPTRELAIQVAKELTSFMPSLSKQIIPIYGGGSIEKQSQQLKRSNGIVVGTPGRILDHIRRKRLNLTQLETLVLDEADEMLNRGFLEELEDILKVTNEEKRVLLFSATMPPYILQLAERYMGDYDQIAVSQPRKLNDRTDQMYYEVLPKEKTSALIRILDIQKDIYTIVFCRTRLDVDQVSEELVRYGYPAAGIHGDFSQSQRNRVLDGFRSKQHRILVATDVAARGLDINNLTHVINYSLPQDMESYVHRIGRTGRAGRSGIAITLISPSEHRSLLFYQKKLNTTIRKERIPSPESIQSIQFEQLVSDYNDPPSLDTQSKYVDLAKVLLENQDPQSLIAGMLQHIHHAKDGVQSYPHVTDLFDGKSYSNRSFKSKKSNHKKRFSDKRRRSRSYS